MVILQLETNINPPNWHIQFYHSYPILSLITVEKRDGEVKSLSLLFIHPKHIRRNGSDWFRRRRKTKARGWYGWLWRCTREETEETSGWLDFAGRSLSPRRPMSTIDKVCARVEMEMESGSCCWMSLWHPCSAMTWVGISTEWREIIFCSATSMGNTDGIVTSSNLKQIPVPFLLFLTLFLSLE